MSMSDRARRLAAASVPAASLPFYGAQVGHSPARENASYRDCPRCGGAQRDKFGRVTPNRAAATDPVKDHEAHIALNHGTAMAEPLAMTCGHCGRSAHDGTAAMLAATKPGDGESREGFEDLGPGASKARGDQDAADDPSTVPATPLPTPARPLTRKERRAGMARQQGA